MKKIVIFSKSCWNTWNFRKELIYFFSNKNYEIYVLAENDNYHSNLLSLNCKVHHINFQNTKINPIYDILNLLKILYYLMKIKPECVFSFNLKPIILSNLATKILNIKNIAMITGAGSALDRQNIIQFFVKFIYKLTLKNTYHVLFQNSDDRSFFIKNKIIKSITSSIVPGSGVNIDEIKYKKLKNSDQLVFLCASRLLYSKGIKEYCDAAKIIKKKYHNNVTFKLIGEFEKSKRGLNKNYIYDLNNSNIIEFKKFTDDIIDEIYQSDCVVLPSHREGTSKFLLEALACGRPIITSDSIGCNHMIYKKINGYICKNKNYLDLANKITKFINLPDKIKKEMSYNSRIYAEEKFDVKLVLNKYSKLMSNV